MGGFVSPAIVSTRVLTMAASLVWIDCEMTGLEAMDKLIEVAVIVTDDNLNIVTEISTLIPTASERC